MKTTCNSKPSLAFCCKPLLYYHSEISPAAECALTDLPPLLLQRAAGKQAACSSCQLGLSLVLSIDVTLVLLLMSSGADYAKPVQDSSMTQIIWMHCLYIIKPNLGEIRCSIGFTMCIPGKYWAQKGKEGGMTAGILSYKAKVHFAL